MTVLPNMKSLQFQDGEMDPTGISPICSGTKFPFGMTLSMSERELNIANLGGAEVAPGTLLHLHIMAEVTSVSKRAGTGDGKRVEMQVTHICTEDEDNEEGPDGDEVADAHEAKPSMFDKWKTAR